MTVLALRRGEKIVVVNFELAGPVHCRMILVVGETMEGAPSLGGIATMEVQPAAQGRRLARLAK